MWWLLTLAPVAVVGVAVGYSRARKNNPENFSKKNIVKKVVLPFVFMTVALMIVFSVVSSIVTLF